MGPYHKFFCFREGEVQYSECIKHLKDKTCVVISDDLIRYMNDSFLWIPCIHVSGSYYRKNSGLFLYGHTIINQEGVDLFHGIIESWELLFSKAPKQFELTGSLLLDNEKKSIGEFRKIQVDRDILIGSLKALAEYASQLVDGEHYIAHFGI